MKNEKLAKRKEELKTDLEKNKKEFELLNNELIFLKRLEKPYALTVCSVSGIFTSNFETLTEAEESFNRQNSEEIFRSKFKFGSFIFLRNEDGTKSLIKEKSESANIFDASEYLKDIL